MFYTIQDGQILTAQNEGALSNYYDNVQVLPVDYEVGKYIVENNSLVRNPNYEAEQEQKERERIAKLSCTKRDFVLILQELGVDYFTQLKPLIESNPQAQLEWELCERLYRFNPLLDVMALQLGITSEQLDGLFRYANGEITIEQFREINKEPNVDNSEEVEEENPVVDDIPDGDVVDNLEG